MTSWNRGKQCPSLRLSWILTWLCALHYSMLAVVGSGDQGQNFYNYFALWRSLCNFNELVMLQSLGLHSLTNQTLNEHLKSDLRGAQICVNREFHFLLRQIWFNQLSSRGRDLEACDFLDCKAWRAKTKANMVWLANWLVGTTKKISQKGDMSVDYAVTASFFRKWMPT